MAQPLKICANCLEAGALAGEIFTLMIGRTPITIPAECAVCGQRKRVALVHMRPTKEESPHE